MTKPIPIHALLAAAAALLLSTGVSFADGKMYAEKVPTTIPYQRALILHDAGVQTLVLQSQYQIPGNVGVRSLGWVVPVPAPPEVASLAANHAERLFQTLDAMSLPKVIRIGPMVLMVLIGLSMATVLLSFGWSFMTRNAVRRRQCVRIGRWAGVVFLLCLLLGPFFINMRKGVGGVEILSARHTGIYDVQVVRSNDAGELRAWLHDNSFRFGAEDEKAIQAYLDRGWCFVVAKLDPTAKDDWKPVVFRGLLAPLILRFPTAKPIYPVALTATGGQPTEILIYLASNTPMTTTSPLTLRFSGESLPLRMPYVGMHGLNFADPPDFFDFAQLKFRYLSKFKATLTPAEMAKDIEFLPTPNAPAYYEQFYRW